MQQLASACPGLVLSGLKNNKCHENPGSQIDALLALIESLHSQLCSEQAVILCKTGSTKTNEILQPDEQCIQVNCMNLLRAERAPVPATAPGETWRPPTRRPKPAQGEGQWVPGELSRPPWKVMGPVQKEFKVSGCFK